MHSEVYISLWLAKMGCDCSSFGRSVSAGPDPINGSCRRLVETHMKKYPVLLYSTVKSEEGSLIKALLRRYQVAFEAFEVEYMRMAYDSEPTEEKSRGQCV